MGVIASPRRRHAVGIDPDWTPSGEIEAPTPIISSGIDSAATGRSTTPELSTGAELSTEARDGALTGCFVRYAGNRGDPAKLAL